MSKITELELFSLFTADPVIAEMIPSVLKTEALNVNHEQVLCVNKTGLKHILSMTRGVHPSRIYLEAYKRDRGYVEYFGDDIQLIGAACIHDAKHVLTLELTENKRSVTGYHVGSLTYPQGHCTFDNEVTKMMTEPENNTIVLSSLMKRIREDAFREVTEEVHVEAPSLDLEFSKLVKSKIVEPVDAAVYPIYLDTPGSARRHLCMLFDVDVSGTAFDGNLDMVTSNEPSKHTVRVMSYEDFIDLDKTDLICPWIAKSFAMLPFYRQTFIEDYIVKCARKAAF